MAKYLCKNSDNVLQDNFWSISFIYACGICSKISYIFCAIKKEAYKQPITNINVLVAEYIVH